jgi:hypothetical protein
LGGTYYILEEIDRNERKAGQMQTFQKEFVFCEYTHRKQITWVFFKLSKYFILRITIKINFLGFNIEIIFYN